MHVRGVDVEGLGFELSAEHGRWVEASDTASLDLVGLHCLPGLVDAHAHLSADSLDVTVSADPGEVMQRAGAALRAGVSIVADKGWDDDLVLEMVRHGRLTAPRVEAAGRMIRPSDGYWVGFGELADDADLVGRAAAFASNRPWVKIVADWPRRGRGAVPNYSEEVLTAAVDAVHANGGRVSVHTMAPDVAGCAVRAGVDSIEHGLFLDEDDLELLATRNGMWVPTVLRMEQVLGEMRAGSSGAELLGRGLENVRRLLPRAAELGVNVLAGSDLAVGVAEIGSEVQALARMGYPPRAALDAATLGAARALGHEVGLRPGCLADLVAYERNPLDDLAALATPAVVVFGGSLIVDLR